MIKSISRKKKVLLFIVSFSIIAAFLYNYGFFSRYNYLTAKYDIHKNNVRIIFVGSTGVSYFPLKSLRKKYNIGMELVHRSIPANNITYRGADIYDIQMEKQIQILLGEKRYRKYLHELDSIYKKFSKPLSNLEIPEKK